MHPTTALITLLALTTSALALPAQTPDIEERGPPPPSWKRGPPPPSWKRGPPPPSWKRELEEADPEPLIRSSGSKRAPSPEAAPEPEPQCKPFFCMEEVRSTTNAFHVKFKDPKI
ncbi:hypothetical protein QBC40DRAFT_325338 [Triangularia verruculosa]|uniref:Uncharacterized protein n=1 Tax=Triangularia verruculosa TaxID=2587418 RepID=A0AAN6XIP7_9PEZI|nr:hypothetical protein QBC40DRAFT_325338 [Triangularia verruculosa]